MHLGSSLSHGSRASRWPGAACTQSHSLPMGGIWAKPSACLRSSCEQQPAPSSKGDDERIGVQIVLGKYKMFMGPDDIMGEGTSSICRRGENIQTNEPVAIKVYKEQGKGSARATGATLRKFQRQIHVLQELLEPFTQPDDASLWHDQLAHAQPANLFMKLIDYSKHASTGEPGPDSRDGVLYVVTELAQYSMKDYFASFREQKKKFSVEEVKSIAKAMLLVMAGLHAKGLVHLDFKPENMMMFDGRLKLIDVDGCVKVGTQVSISDSTISFSPCYCAPEWANFLIDEGASHITISPTFDVWSVGMTLCELVTLDAMLKPVYTNFLHNARSHQEAGFLFMDWLSSSKAMNLPRSIARLDSHFAELLNKWLLVCDRSKRKSCAQSLDHDFLAGAKDLAPVDQAPSRQMRVRPKDEDNKAPLFKSTLFKLDTDGDVKNAVHWRKRDMWIAANGSLCYFSQKEHTRLVLIDGSKLGGSDAKVEQFAGGIMDFAFKIQVHAEEDDNRMTSYYFACESEVELQQWMKVVKGSVRVDMPTMALGKNYADECRKFLLKVRNRRQKVDTHAADADEFGPAHKGKLWKLKGEGDAQRPGDWFEREMWIAVNGSFVYYSPKEERSLVYYTSADILHATITELGDNDACRPFAFQILLPPSCEGLQFAPGVFSAPSEQDRARWIAEFRKLAHN